MRPPQPTKPMLMRSFAPSTRPFAIAGAWRAAASRSPPATVPATAAAPAPTFFMKSRRVVSSRFIGLLLKAPAVPKGSTVSFRHSSLLLTRCLDAGPVHSRAALRGRVGVGHVPLAGGAARRGDQCVRAAGRPGDRALCRVADALQPDEHRRRRARPGLGRRGGQLPQLQHRQGRPADAPRRRPHPHPRGHQRRRPCRLGESLRAGRRPARTARPRGHRASRHRLGVPEPHRLHGRETATMCRTGRKCC